MKDNGRTYSGYIPLEEHQVTEIDSDGKVRLRGPDSCTRIRVSYVVVLIGSRPNLSFMESSVVSRLAVDDSAHISCRNNPVDVDLFSLESTKERGLYAMGPLVADNFVRFAQGGALAITNNLLHTKLSRNHPKSSQKSIQQQQQQQQHTSTSISSSIRFLFE